MNKDDLICGLGLFAVLGLLPISGVAGICLLINSIPMSMQFFIGIGLVLPIVIFITLIMASTLKTESMYQHYMTTGECPGNQSSSDNQSRSEQ